jgi:ERCC4-related helicase
MYFHFITSSPLPPLLLLLPYVINNMKVERVEVRSEDDPAIAPYVHEKQIEFIK